MTTPTEEKILKDIEKLKGKETINACVSCGNKYYKCNCEEIEKIKLKLEGYQLAQKENQEKVKLLKEAIYEDCTSDEKYIPENRKIMCEDCNNVYDLIDKIFGKGLCE